MKIREIAAACLLLSFSGMAIAEPTRWDWRELAAPPAFSESLVNGLPRGLIVTDSGVQSINDIEDPGPRAYCFAPGTVVTPELQAQLDQLILGGFQSRYQIGDRWSMAGTVGTPISLTWSFVPDGTSWDGVASILFSRMNTLFSGNTALWISQFQSVFDRWSALSGVTYTRVTFGGNQWDDGAPYGSAGSSGLRGDIRIGMRNIDGASNILAYNQFPDAGDMVIDSSENWNSSSNTYRFLRNTVSHEHGHGLGFNHSCPQNGTKLMEPGLNTNFDGPQQDEIRAVQRNYGDINEPNDTSATATPVDGVAGGAVDPLTPGVSVFLGTVPSPANGNASTISIDANADVDWYSFTTTSPRLFRVRAFPVGTNYAGYAQDANCNNTTANTNAIAMADLSLTVYNTNGTSVLRAQNTGAIGSEELIANLLLGPAGTYFFRVEESGSPTQSQLYRLEVLAQNDFLFVSASDGTVSGQVRVDWSGIPDADSYQVLRSPSPILGTGQIVATVTPPTIQIFDTPPTNGDTYYYSVRARQPGATGYRFFVEQGEGGFADAPPVANAGPDQTVTDADNSGAETVTLDGSASSDNLGITNYRWDEGVTLLAQGPSPTANVSFSVGVHTVTLTVTDALGATNSDDVIITVEAGGLACPWSGVGCIADFNGSGGTPDDADVVAFFSAWNSGDPCADANDSGGTPDDADITTFFGLWNNGGC